MRRWRKYRNRSHVPFKAIAIIIFFFAFMVFLQMHLHPVVTAVTTNQARIKSINTINSVIADELNKNGVSYNDLVNIQRDSTNGKVLSITTQMVKMNELKAAIINDVQKEMGGDGHTDIGIPLGTLLGNDLLHGYGPKIPLRLTLSGNVNAEFKSLFESAGINQTRHQIYLNIHTSVYSFLPGFSTTTEVDTNIPVAETVIVGEVPEVVANIK